MSTIAELIKTEADGSLSFGDYTLSSKTKKDGFEHDGATYKVKTFNEITKLEMNGCFAYESVPGTAVNNFSAKDGVVNFAVEGASDAEITLGLEEEKEYEIFINGESTGTMKTNLGGKLTLSVELGEATVDVKIVRK